jgi:hypothetical protein
MKFIFLNSSHLGLNPVKKADFMGRVTEAMNNKFQNSGVYVINDNSILDRLPIDSEVKTIFVHNNPNIEISGGAEALGVSNGIWAEVNVDDFDPSVFEKLDPTTSLANQVGTVASHEGFHLFGPRGHSLLEGNLMSAGPENHAALFDGDGKGLEFTDFQKDLLRLGDEIDETQLSNLEEMFNQSSEQLFEYFGGIEFEDIEGFDIADFLDQIT